MAIGYGVNQIQNRRKQRATTAVLVAETLMDTNTIRVLIARPSGWYRKTNTREGLGTVESNASADDGNIIDFGKINSKTLKGK